MFNNPIRVKLFFERKGLKIVTKAKERDVTETNAAYAWEIYNVK